jgi:hypothetical protein
VARLPAGDRLVTHRFEAHLAGYVGWQWYATLARVPRGKEATVCEVGLLPSEKSLLAPEWVPWADRVRPEEVAAAAEAEAAETAEAQDDAETAPATDAAEETPATAGEDETVDAEAAATAGEDAAAEDAPAAMSANAPAEEAPATAGEDEAADAAANEKLTEAAENDTTEEFTEATS